MEINERRGITAKIVSVSHEFALFGQNIKICRDAELRGGVQ